MKLYNSTLNTLSKKRQAMIDSGLIPKYKPRKPIRQISHAMKVRIASYRQACFNMWGRKCFLCGREDFTCKTLDCHHYLLRKNGDDPKFIFPLCNRFTGCRAHNHRGTDGLKELNDKIDRKLTSHL